MKRRKCPLYKKIIRILANFTVRQNLLATILAVFLRNWHSLLQSLQHPLKTNSINLNTVGTYSSETWEKRVLHGIRTQKTVIWRIRGLNLCKTIHGTYRNGYFYSHRPQKLNLKLSQIGTYLRVFENSVLRGIFGCDRDEVTGSWRLHNEELFNLYSSPNIIRVIKSRRMIQAGNVTLCGRE